MKHLVFIQKGGRFCQTAYNRMAVDVDLAPVLAALALFILLARVTFGLSSYRRPVPARVIGFSEIGFGTLVVLLVAAGYILGF